jgi:hypothetical protein
MLVLLMGVIASDDMIYIPSFTKIISDIEIIFRICITSII